MWMRHALPEGLAPKPAAVLVLIVAALIALSPLPTLARDPSPVWLMEWRNTDFTKSSVNFDEILSGGPPKDGIPSIDSPLFVSVAEERSLADTEPVISLVIDGEARAYPLRILTWHEIVNDVVAGVPVAVTYCPLCNAAIVFDRRIGGQDGGRVLEFGTTGKLRRSDLVMYDRQTESWWQQFSGEAIVGELTGTRLTVLPSRLESWARFKDRAPNGRVLIPNNPEFRAYGRNPYPGYDNPEGTPFLYRGPMPGDLPPMMRVVVVDGEAWTLPMLRRAGTITRDDLTLRWEAGQNSALDSQRIDRGRDVGNVVVQRGTGPDARDVVHDITFAFVFKAFHPSGKIHADSEPAPR